MSQKNIPISNNKIAHFFQGAFSIDIAIFSFHESKLKVLLQKKEEEHSENKPGLIGKLLLPKEDTNEALDKLLNEMIGFNTFYKKELSASSDLNRHPLGRVVTFAFYGLLAYEQIDSRLLKNLKWFALEDVPELSYDHNQLLQNIIRRFRKGLLRHPIVFEMLSDEFILSDVITIYEQAFEKKIDKPNFRRQLRNSKLVLPTGKYNIGAHKTGRPPELYTFDKAQYKQIRDAIHFNF